VKHYACAIKALKTTGVLIDLCGYLQAGWLLMQSLAVQREKVSDLKFNIPLCLFSSCFHSVFHHFLILLSIHHTSLSTIGHKKDEEDKKCDNTVNAKHYENKHGINKKEMIKDRYNKNAKAMVKSRFHYSYMER